MNANELADYITQNSYIGTVTMEDVATMLRQQQAEIEALKNAKRFIQNFAEEQHQRAVGLEAETEALNQRIEYMREKASLWEAEAHAGGFEAGRQQAFFDRARKVAKQIDNNEYHTPED
jgi:hypothetical protein